MINAHMRFYEYFLYGEKSASGFPTLSTRSKGRIKIAIEVASQSVQESIAYSNCSYVGFTRDDIDDTYVIQYGNERLKVQYVNPNGRLKQVFLARM